LREMEVDGMEVAPAAKRQKLTNGSARPHYRPGTSRIFAPYRTVGLVSPTSVPFTTVPLGKTSFQFTTSVGRSLQTYDLRRGLNVVFISRPQTPEVITASAAWKDKVVAAWGGQDQKSTRGVWVFKRGKKETELELPRRWQQNVQRFCIFGSWIVGLCETQLLVWKSSTLELYTTLQGVSPILFTGCIASLPTFLNKVIVGREDGGAEIWNVSSGKLVYTILPPSNSHGAVTAIEPTPALSMVAIAYENGPLLICDIRTDQTIIQLNTPSGVPVTSIAFRTDGVGAGEDGKNSGVMATASTGSGDVTLWDLNEGGRKVGVLRAAHAHPTASTPGGASKIEFLPGQAILVSSGLDNSLKTWIFDEMPFNPIPRILHSRSGHGAPVTKLHFLPSTSDGSDDTGKWLMSASKDHSLWGWSLRRDGQSTELSQGAVQKKARKQGLLAAGNRNSLDELKCPPITSIACSLNRDGGIGAIPGRHAVWQGNRNGQVSAEVSSMTGWESLVTAHENDNKARTWFWGRKRAGRWAFQTGDNSNVTSVAMSPCGTFAIIGCEKGGIDMFNMQSGIHRQRFPARLTPMQAKQLRLDFEKHGLIEDDNGSKKFYRGQGKHAAAVVGLAIDNLNKTVVSAGADGKIKFWDFASGLLAYEINWSYSTKIVSMRYHRASDLAAFSCADGCIRVVDISTRKLIRELWPSRFPIDGLSGLAPSDFVFSNDGNWIAACVGHIVLLWDLPTGHLIDAFKLNATCTSLTFSPTGEFLATATSDSVGVDVWSNRALFTHVSTRHIGVKELTHIVTAETQLSAAGGEGADLVLAGPKEDDIEDDINFVEADGEANIDLLTSDLLSLSLVPQSRWQNLLHLDLIRQRNKPVEPPKKPAKAPFFLPSLEKRQSKAASAPTNVTDASTTGAEQSRVGRLGQHGVNSQFSNLLHASAESNDFLSVVEHLQGLNPAAADIAIRSMGQNNGDMIVFVQALTWLMRQRRDFELGQAWMAVFLRIHGDVVLTDDRLWRAVEEWSVALQEEKRRVQRLASYCNGVVGYLRAARV
jgi:U3 small nucleolar RNA-associated protein 21